MHHDVQTFWIMCARGICGWVSIDTLDQYLDWYSINILIDTRSALAQLAEYRPTHMNWSKIRWLSTKCWLRCRVSVNWGVDGVLMEYQSSFDRGYRSWVLIDTWLQMPLVNIFWVFSKLLWRQLCFFCSCTLFHVILNLVLGPQGISTVIVEKGTPGLSFGKKEKKVCCK